MTLSSTLFFLVLLIERIGIDLVFSYPTAVTNPCSNCLRHGVRLAAAINLGRSKKRIVHAFNEISFQQRSISRSPYQLVVRVRVCACVCTSVDWICLQSDEHTREKREWKREKERRWIEKRRRRRRKTTYHRLVSHPTSVSMQDRYIDLQVSSLVDEILKSHQRPWFCHHYSYLMMLMFNSYTHTCKEVSEFALRDYES